MRPIAKLRTLAAAGLPRQEPPTEQYALPADRKDFQWSSGDWVSSNRPGNVYSSNRSWYFEPQTAINYAALVGDIWTNSAVQAVLNWIIQAWPESYPCVR